MTRKDQHDPPNKAAERLREMEEARRPRPAEKEPPATEKTDQKEPPEDPAGACAADDQP